MASFAAGFDFPFDDFQDQALRALENNKSVLVAAPTGSGKTLVGEFSLFLALKRGVRAFYTTPIKALSNQKFRDFSATYGSENVGLLTGDISVNPSAPLVVMTTEVLRNMLYRDDGRLDDLGFVVLDEVHYLADRYRGPVWEEVILHLGAQVKVIALSATVSNAEEFGQWLRQVRGNVEIVVSEKRPVPLYQHMLVGGRLFDLEVKSSGGKTKLNPVLLARTRRGLEEPGRGHHTSLPATVEELNAKGLLPAIIFIFSRARCQQGQNQLVAAGIDLTSPAEKRQISARLDEISESIPPGDVLALGLDTLFEGLRRGIAVHHAGLLPVLKEAVEKMFAAGLLKVVLATETLALGINMPARSVVIESLRKWDGHEFVMLSAGQYTQLTGRAGRRGIDTLGHGIVMFRPGMDPATVAALASKRTYPLKSAFSPTYNMAVNLLERGSLEGTRDVLRRSFAQFQADRAVVGKAQQAADKQRAADEIVAAKSLECSYGDIYEYVRIKSELEARDARHAQLLAREQARRRWDLFSSLKRGDVLAYKDARRARHGIVMKKSGTRTGETTLTVLADNAKLRNFSSNEFAGPLALVGQMWVKDYSERKPRDRQRLASKLRAAVREGIFSAPKSATSEDEAATSTKPGVSTQETSSQIPDINGRELTQLSELELTELLTCHPAARCPQLDSHLKKASRWTRLERQAARLRRQVDISEGALVDTFDRVVNVLIKLGYLDPNGQVTESGAVLCRIYSEYDLLLAQCALENVFAGLGPAQLAAACSAASYEARREEAGAPVPAALKSVVTQIETLAADLRQVQSELQAPELPQSSSALVAATYAWARGKPLSVALEAAPIEAGDFVRAMKQLLDVLRQLEMVGSVETSATARKAQKLILRGVVAWSDI
ncbi:DEAD/DEAH box helicase [Varibaculum cambriense]|uniref:DEAD/DEAH box helicase n=1 Tax=Varibaculum cambriense TaxID=184870 RepID=UPI00290AEB0F|nr:DEAD/DEAH box helicase [Varibaculum cambriense]MDU5542038.1 DEAD/DEAH box helicase [Varibaculum cambriense]